MVKHGVEPNEHTITSILMACRHLLGKQIHAYMVKTMIDQSVYAYSALIDLYSRSYEVNEAKLVFEKLDDKNVVPWSSMISCYSIITKRRMHQNCSKRWFLRI